jgi:DNA-binding CsgD family transcriptional regulator
MTMTLRQIEKIWLYDEQSLQWPLNTSPVGTPSLLNAYALECTSPQMWHERVRADLQSMDFHGMEYQEVLWVQDRPEIKSIYHGHSSFERCQTYSRQHLSWVDPRLQMPRSKMMPSLSLWSLEQWQTEIHLNHHLQRAMLIEQLQKHHIHSGMTMMLPTETPNQYAVIHWFSSQYHLNAEVEKRQQAGLVMGFNLHHLISAKKPAPNLECKDDLNLTSKQFLMAECVVQGMSDKAIARHLDMGIHAVDFHMRTLRKKFMVTNRVQLAQMLNQLLDCAHVKTSLLKNSTPLSFIPPALDIHPLALSH